MDWSYTFAVPRYVVDRTAKRSPLKSSFQGRFNDAESLYAKVLNARRITLGVEHPDTLASLNNLAALYRKRRRYREAEPLFKRVMDVQRRLQGEHHSLTLLAATNLAGVYAGMGRLQVAESLYRKTLDGYEQTVGREHPHTLHHSG